MTKTPSHQAEPWRIAAAKLACAEALLLSVPAARAEICAMLVAGWRALLGSESAPSDEALSRLLPKHDPKLRAELEVAFAGDPLAENTLDLDILTDALARALARLDPKAKRRRRFLLGAYAVLGLALIMALAWTYQMDTEQVWRARFFSLPDLKGAPARDTFRRLKFDWGRDRPHRNIPADGFSARFDTCLRVTHPGRAVFNVRVEDGARLTLGGSKIIDAWKAGKLQNVSAEVELLAGTQHLRVDYFNVSGAASLSVRASFDGGPSELLDARHLKLPADEALSPCDAP